MMVIIAALSVAAIASWSQWSVTDVPPQSPAPTVIDSPSPTGPAMATQPGLDDLVSPADP
jgi:hypothetical protein